MTQRPITSVQRVVCNNRAAMHHYHIEETIEAGIALIGSEVKALRLGEGHIHEAYASAEDGCLYLVNAHIPAYSHASGTFAHAPRRPRALLLHRRQMNRWMGKAERKGYTIVPLKLYFNPRNIIKVELGLAKGKHTYDQRERVKTREWERTKARIMKGDFRDA